MDNESAKNESLSKLQKLIDQGVNLNTKDANGRTLLHHAVSNNEPEVVKCLLENGADPFVLDDKSNSILHIAVTDGHDDVVRVILENVARDKLKKMIDMKMKTSGNTALHVAVNSNCHSNTIRLLEYGAKFEIANNDRKKPVDVTTGNYLGKLLRLIDSSFAMAKIGDESMLLSLTDCAVYRSDDLDSVLNCRNNNGYTIVQWLLVNDQYKLVTNLTALRSVEPSTGFLEFDDPNRKKEVERLAEITREFRSFWKQTQENILTMTTNIQKLGKEQFNIVTRHVGRIGCEALERAHEVLLAYRKYEGKKKTLTANPMMKNLEEALEVLGFETEQIYVIVGEDASYYQKIPSKFKENIGWLINFMNCVVDASMFYFLKCIYTVQIFDAVKANDIDRVQDLLKKEGNINGIDWKNRTALTYAIENGNKKMIRFLLKSGAEVACHKAETAIFFAINNCSVKIFKSLLESIDPKDMPGFIDYLYECGTTALHKAAKKGRLDLVKMLLRFGATYWIFDKEKRTPVDVSTNKEVTTFLKIVDECFHDAKEADVELIHKLKAMDKDEFMAVAGTKNYEGHTLATVAAKANGKNIAVIILRMIREAKVEEY